MNRSYIIVDVESVPDGSIISRTKYPLDGYSDSEAVSHALFDATADGKSDFIPYTHQIPVAVGLAKISPEYELKELGVLYGDPQMLATKFWKYYAKNYASVLITFGGRIFDLPLLELMAFKYGITIHAGYWGKYGARNRYSEDQIDLADWFSNYGACRISGGLDVLSKLLCRPGKIVSDGKVIDGSRVHEMYTNGDEKGIREYCERDVRDTYAIFLRSRVMIGSLSVEEESQLLAM